MNTTEQQKNESACFQCKNWEPKFPDGCGPKRQLAKDGYCPIFDKQTDAHHGKQCTAWEAA